MQLSTFGESKNDTTASNVNSISDDVKQQTDTNQGVGEQTQSINPTESVSQISDTDAIPKSPAESADEVTVGNSEKTTADSIKPIKKSKIRPILAFLMIIIIMAFGVAVSWYFINIRQEKTEDLENTTPIEELKKESEEQNIGGEGDVVESVATDDSNLEDISGIDGLTLEQAEILVDGIAKTFESNGFYPWDKLGNKPIPLMTDLYDTDGNPALAWLKTETTTPNPLAEQMDLVAFTQNINTNPIKIFGFSSWYAVCFMPDSAEYKDRAIYNKYAQESEGEGAEFICIKRDILPSTQDPTALEGF